MVRDLTLLGRERPADVFDTAMKLFVQRFDLTIHQRLIRAFAIGSVDVNENRRSGWPGSGTQVAIGHETMHCVESNVANALSLVKCGQCIISSQMWPMHCL